MGNDNPQAKADFYEEENRRLRRQVQLLQKSLSDVRECYDLLVGSLINLHELRIEYGYEREDIVNLEKLQYLARMSKEAKTRDRDNGIIP